MHLLLSLIKFRFNIGPTTFSKACCTTRSRKGAAEIRRVRAELENAGERQVKLEAAAAELERIRGTMKRYGFDTAEAMLAAYMIARESAHRLSASRPPAR